MKSIGSRGFITAFIAAAFLPACGGGGSYGGGSSGGGASYTVGGSVLGLAGTLVLQNNGGNDDTITTNGNFTFTNAVPYLAAYNVTVLSQPGNQSCSVSNGAGTVPAGNVTNVIVECVFVPVPGDIVITEVMADPAGAPDTGKEWFEVLNTSPNTLHLDGMVVTANSDTFTVPSGVSIAPGALFIFAGSGDSTANGGLPAVDVNYGSALTLVNTNISLSLSVAGTAVDSVAFATMPAGASLALSQAHLNPTDNDNPANWCTSAAVYGTAGNKGTPQAANDCP
jgi:hypothetical protein